LEALERQGWRHACHGGCVLNETAVAARHLLAQGAARRLAVLDLDAHFGDGTAWHFYEEPDVLCISLHVDQSDAHVFPYLKGKAQERGSGRGAGYTLNLPLTEGMGDAEAMALLEEFAFPALAEHAPELLFLSLGFDGLRGDPSQAGLNYTDALFQHVAARCRSICMRTLCTLQGGYLTQEMAAAVGGVLRVLAGEPPAAALDARPLDKGFDAQVQAFRRLIPDKLTWWSVQDSFGYVPEGFEGGEEKVSVGEGAAEAM